MNRPPRILDYSVFGVLALTTALWISHRQSELDASLLDIGEEIDHSVRHLNDLKNWNAHRSGVRVEARPFGILSRKYEDLTIDTNTPGVYKTWVSMHKFTGAVHSATIIGVNPPSALASIKSMHVFSPAADSSERQSVTLQMVAEPGTEWDAFIDIFALYFWKRTPETQCRFQPTGTVD